MARKTLTTSYKKLHPRTKAEKTKPIDVESE